MMATYARVGSTSSDPTTKHEEFILTCSDISKSYGDLPVLDAVSMQVRKGEFVGLIGPNGSGKTTLLEIIEGVNSPTSGSVQMFGLESRLLSTEQKGRIGLVFQRYALPDYVTVGHLITIFRSFVVTDGLEDILITQLGLVHILDQLVGNLSAGQQQRLAVLVALLGNRDIVLMDEPTSALDLRSRQAVWETILERKRSRQLTGILATHNLHEATLLCDRLMFIKDGKICAEGPLASFVGGRVALVISFNAPKKLISNWSLLNEPEFYLTSVASHYELVCPRMRASAVLETLMKAEESLGFDAKVSVSERALEKTYMDIYRNHA